MLESAPPHSPSALSAVVATPPRCGQSQIAHDAGRRRRVSTFGDAHGGLSRCLRWLLHVTLGLMALLLIASGVLQMAVAAVVHGAISVDDVTGVTDGSYAAALESYAAAVGVAMAPEEPQPRWWRPSFAWLCACVATGGGLLCQRAALVELCCARPHFEAVEPPAAVAMTHEGQWTAEELAPRRRRRRRRRLRRARRRRRRTAM